VVAVEIEDCDVVFVAVRDDVEEDVIAERSSYRTRKPLPPHDIVASPVHAEEQSTGSWGLERSERVMPQ